MNYKEITSHEIACKILDRDPNAMPDLSMRPEHQQKLIIGTLKLLDVAEAINKIDDFEADWNDTDQEKWYPWFDGSEGFAFSGSFCDDWGTGTTVGSRLCFRNEEISDFFGKEFNPLHIETLTVK